MVLGLKLHHQISPIPSTNLDLKPQTNLINPFFQIKQIQTRSVNSSRFYIKSRTISSTGFKLKPPSSKESNGNGDGGGGGVADDRRKDRGGDGDGDGYAYDILFFYLRCVELLLRALAYRSDVVTVRFPRSSDSFCAKAVLLMWFIMMEILMAFDWFLEYVCVSVLLVASSVVSIAMYWL